MKQRVLEARLHSLIPRLFSFACAIIPDELQAQQLVIDATVAVTVSNRDVLQLILQEDDVDDEGIQNLVDLFRNAVMKQILVIGLRRSAQLPIHDERYSTFYSLDALSRAVLFLKARLDLDMNDLQSIVGYSSLDVLTRLAGARDGMVRSMSSTAIDTDGCERYRHQLLLYRDGFLPQHQEQLALHIRHCDACAGALLAIERLFSKIDADIPRMSLVDPDISTSLKTELSEIIDTVYRHHALYLSLPEGPVARARSKMAELVRHALSTLI